MQRFKALPVIQASHPINLSSKVNGNTFQSAYGGLVRGGALNNRGQRATVIKVQGSKYCSYADYASLLSDTPEVGGSSSGV